MSIGIQRALRRTLGTALIVAPVITGCASAPRQSGALQDTSLDVSTTELRARVRALSKPFSGLIESAGDQILEHATTPAERVMGLKIKINGVPAFQGALFEPDPVAALFETAALIEQTRGYFQTGWRLELPPHVRQSVLQSLDEMRERLATLADQIHADPEGRDRFFATAEEWAAEHPITGSFLARETTQTLFAAYLASEPRGLLATTRRAEESVADVTARLDLYAEYIAKQMRWQAELLLEEALRLDYPGRAVAAVGPVPVGIAELPIDVEAERDHLLDALAGERALLLDWARVERLETLGFVRAERQAITELAERERRLILEALASERGNLMADLDRSRTMLTADLERIVDEAMADARERIVDHVLLRVAQALAVILPLVFLGAWFLVWFAKRP
jgi:hypothetical protein